MTRRPPAKRGRRRRSGAGRRFFAAFAALVAVIVGVPLLLVRVLAGRARLTASVPRDRDERGDQGVLRARSHGDRDRSDRDARAAHRRVVAVAGDGGVCGRVDPRGDRERVALRGAAIRDVRRPRTLDRRRTHGVLVAGAELRVGWVARLAATVHRELGRNHERRAGRDGRCARPARVTPGSNVASRSRRSHSANSVTRHAGRRSGS